MKTKSETKTMEENRFKDSVKLTGEIMDEVSKYFVGDREIIKKILASIYASGHILLEDNPGIGKTFVATGSEMWWKN